MNDQNCQVVFPNSESIKDSLPPEKHPACFLCIFTAFLSWILFLQLQTCGRMSTFPPPLPAQQGGGEREEEEKGRRSAQRSDAVCSCCLTSTPRSPEDAGRLWKPSNSALLPDSRSQRAASAHSDAGCDGPTAGGARASGPGLKLEDWRYCLLCGAGEEDVSAATPPISSTLVYYPKPRG